MKHQVEFLYIWTSSGHEIDIFLDLSLFLKMMSYRMTNLFGNPGRLFYHFFSDISVFLGLRHKTNVRLAKIISIGTVTKFLNIGKCFGPVSREISEDFDAIDHRIDPLS